MLENGVTDGYLSPASAATTYANGAAADAAG